MVRSEAVSTPTKKKKKSKSLEVRKSKCSKSKEKSSATNSSATGISKRKKKSNKKAAVVDDGCTGGLKLLKGHTVTMASLTKAQVLKDPLEVELDQHGDPLEANGSNLQSYTGVLARTKVPINIESWPKVGKLLKNTIWDTILESFDLEPSERKMVIKSAGVKWREFKSRLTCQYVLPYIDDPESLKFPPDDYRFITPDVWKDFVKSRLTPEFLEKHEKQRERRLQNQYNHRMSRKGYRGLKRELIKMGIPEEDIDRTLLWIKGQWKEIVNNAISNFNSDRNKKGRRKINWKNMRGIPEQNDTTSCGYYVMRYMRDIVLDTERTFADKWASRTGKPCPYEQVKIDEVRDELAGYVLKNMID
ncbi:hypothetical protein ACLB2K_006792 [Fragaria x ananassa]